MSKFDSVLNKISEGLPVLPQNQQVNGNNSQQPVTPDAKQVAALIKTTFGIDVDHNAIAKILPQQPPQQPNKPNITGQNQQQNTQQNSVVNKPAV
jgi:hypothetical protein